MSAYCDLAMHPDGPDTTLGGIDRVQSILCALGANLVFDGKSHDIDMVVGNGDDPVADAVNLFMRIGPAAAAARDLGKDARPVIRERLTAALTPYTTDRTVRLTGAVWIVTATN